MIGGEREIRIIDVASLGLTDDVMKTLIKQGYDVNKEDEEGNQPALIAASRNNFEMLKVLVEAGADVDIYGPSGDSPLGYANRFNNIEMIELIHNSINKQNIAYTRARP